MGREGSPSKDICLIWRSSRSKRTDRQLTPCTLMFVCMSLIGTDVLRFQAVVKLIDCIQRDVCRKYVFNK